MPTFKDHQLEMITISKFTKDLLNKFSKKHLDKEISISKKSELMLELSVVWSEYFSDYKDELFFESFNHLTELRSHSTDLLLMDEALLDFDEDKRKIIKVFWHFLDSAETVDEQ